MGALELTKQLLLFINCLIIICYLSHTASAQRSLHHWKRDLEYRLTLYRNQRNAIDNIIASSIYPARGQINGPIRITSNGNVRFSDLIVPVGSLVLDSHIAKPTVRIMVDKTQSYVTSKLNELFQIRSQLDVIHRQLDDPSQKFIYKGLRDGPHPQYNFTNKILGTRIFKQVHYAHIVESHNVSLKRINYTNVDRVINETYMLNPQFNLVDSDGRLFFEGRKTFWNTVFSRPLKSGCCDRLKPLHTSRMMLRSINQDVLAPVLIYSRDAYNGQSAIIRQLTTNQIYNRILAMAPRSLMRQPDNIGLLPSAPENFIRLPNLISIRQLDQPQILKTVVFKNMLHVDEAYLSNSYVDSRLVIGFLSVPGLRFDLSHDNYLLRFMATKNNTSFVQQVRGSVVVGSSTHFVAGVDADIVNRVENFNRFIQEAVVRIDRPATIRGTVQFNALPALLNPMAGPSRSPQNVLVMHVGRGLEVGLVNGMRLPQHIVLLPVAGYQNPRTLKPTDLIHVHGPRHFTNQIVFHELVQVSGLINGMQMPGGVIPLHLNDFMGSIGYSNLLFMDGISVHHMTVQGGQFDDIILRDVYGDAQSLIVRSVLSFLPDGSQLIRAPIQIVNLNLIGRGPNQGLLNGFRPQEVIELSKYPFDSLHGKKTFLAPVEAVDCVFNAINQVANWTNHLIRTDRPNTVQTIHTKLAFTHPQSYTDNMTHRMPASVNINHFKVEFYPDNNPTNYINNWQFSPEFYIMHQALLRGMANNTGGRYRVLNQVRLMHPSGGFVNNIALNDIVTLDVPFRFADRFVMVGKVQVMGSVRADRITSNYPIDAMDLIQFNKYRIPIAGSRTPIQLSNLVLGQENRASFVQCHMLNGVPLSEFANSIMSLTRPQVVDSNLVFGSLIDFEGMLRTESALNSIKDFRRFATNLKNAKYSFENGLQCSSVVIDG